MPPKEFPETESLEGLLDEYLVGTTPPEKIIYPIGTEVIITGKYELLDLVGYRAKVLNYDTQMKEYVLTLTHDSSNKKLKEGRVVLISKNLVNDNLIEYVKKKEEEGKKK